MQYLCSYITLALRDRGRDRTGVGRSWACAGQRWRGWRQRRAARTCWRTSSPRSARAARTPAQPARPAEHWAPAASASGTDAVSVKVRHKATSICYNVKVIEFLQTNRWLGKQTTSLSRSDTRPRSLCCNVKVIEFLKTSFISGADDVSVKVGDRSGHFATMWRSNNSHRLTDHWLVVQTTSLSRLDTRSRSLCSDVKVI